MSEEQVQSQPVPEAGQPTAGQMLRQARESAGLHVAALAVSMKVPVKKLEALEADRYAELPDAVFARALAASVCRALKVDAAPILSKLPQSAAPKFEHDDRGINMPMRAPGLYYSHSMVSALTKPAVLAVLGILLAALVVVFFPESTTEPVVDAPAPEAPLPTPLANPQLPATEPVAHVPEAGTSLVVSAPAAAASAALAAIPTPVASAPVAANAIVVFKAKETAWIRVTDSKGVVRLEKTLAAAESAGTAGDLPLSVVVGNVGATEVEVRGQPFALDAFNKNNVARFEVK